MRSLVLFSHWFLFVFHLLIGIFVVFQPQLLVVVLVDMFLLLLLQVLFSNNATEAVLAALSYFVAIEVFVRMTNQTFLWEQSKYIVTFFAIIGLFRTRQVKYRNLFILLLFLLPLTLGGLNMIHFQGFMDLRKQFLFDMSGPIALTFLLVYMKDRSIDKEIFHTMLRFGFYPILSMAVYSLIKAPFGTYEFGFSSSGFMSAGYSATQTAPAFVFGAIMLILANIQGKPIFNTAKIDYFFIGLFIFQALLTFSRGAILALVGALLLAGLWSYGSKSVARFLLQRKSIYYTFLLLLLFIVGNLISDAKLYQRYLNRDYEGNQIKEDYTTHRLSIASADMKIFWRHPVFGVGIGEAKYLRGQYGGLSMAASHNEITRVLAEHGIVGLFCLIYIFVLFLVHVNDFHDAKVRFLKSVCALYFVLYITQGAFRIAFPAFLYGLSFLYIAKE